MRIYVSSTYKDLIEERAAAKQAILALEHLPIGMEEYAAADERPLEKCLKDVLSCHAYVGIFAWRYGFCPDGGAKSITQLEYDAARNANKPCYVFILREEAPWPRNLIPDEDQPRIKAFRNQLEDERLAAHFSDRNELAKLVTQSLASAAIATANTREIPNLLPYLCDRSDQQTSLVDVLDRAELKPGRPVVCIVHGDETEAHDRFLERLQKVMLPRLLGREIERAAVQLYRQEWPQGFLAQHDMHRRLLMSLAEEVLDMPGGKSQAVNNRLSQALGPVAIHAHILTQNWEQQNIGAVQMFLRFWEHWPDLAIGQRLLVFLFIKYQFNRNFNFLKRRRYAKINDEIRKGLDSCDMQSFAGITATVLPELQGPTQGEAEDWARGNDARKFCDEDALVAAISHYYGEWEAREKPRAMPVRIPTDRLAPRLKEMMSRTLLSAERAL